MTSPAASDLTRRTVLYVTGGAAAVAAAGFVFIREAPFSAGFLAGAMIAYLGVSAIAVAQIAHTHPYRRFGAANALTLARLVVCSLIGGLAFEIVIAEAMPRPSVAWTFCAMAAAAMVIDGLDGYVARRMEMVSAFGARFDMEVDALQILLLSMIAAALGKAGPWILVAGSLRYLYEVTAVFWPVLRRPLPPSFRRKLVSVVMGGALVALLAPMLAPPLSTAVAGASLLLLVYSFAVDVLRLARDAKVAPTG